MQYKWHFLYENHTFQGQFLHYLVISNRKLEMLMGIYNAYCSMYLVETRSDLNVYSVYPGTAAPGGVSRATLNSYSTHLSCAPLQQCLRARTASVARIRRLEHYVYK